MDAKDLEYKIRRFLRELYPDGSIRLPRDHSESSGIEMSDTRAFMDMFELYGLVESFFVEVDGEQVKCWRI